MSKKKLYLFYLIKSKLIFLKKKTANKKKILTSVGLAGQLHA
jgi:hypothetical protein